MKAYSSRLLSLLVLVLAPVGARAANEVHVCQSGGANFTTIQAAVDAAQPGDVIKVAAATYTEAKLISGTQYNLYLTKSVTILGGYTCADFVNQNAALNVTTIRPFTAQQSVISIFGVNGMTAQVAPTINGFTITGGGGGNHGGGISMHDSDATISNNIITGNTGYLLGGGIWVQRGSPRIQYNRIQNNTADAQGAFAQGGGIKVETATPALLSNIIANNTFTGGGTTNGGGVDIDPFGGSVLLANNTVVGNAVNGVHADSDITLVNNIITSHPIGVSASATVSTSYNIYFGNTANTQGFLPSGTDLTVNPQLTANYHLSPGSPAIDAGTHTNAPSRDIDREPRAMIGTSGLYKIDIGADEVTGGPQTNRELASQPADFTLIGPGNPVENPNSTGPNDWIGYSVAAGDINGDGRVDLIAGAFNFSDARDTVDDSGRVFALYGNGTRRLGTIDLLTTTPSLEVRSNINQQHISSSLTTADLNGDGTRDLIIGAIGAAGFNVKGSVYGFQGGAGLSGIKTLSPTNQATWQFRTAGATSSFADSNELAAGKLNNDGIDDLVVSEGNATGPGNRTNAGAVYVFFGSASLPALTDLATTPASLTIYGPATNSGLSRVAVGDVNGDSKADLIVRSFGNVAYVFYGPLSAGTIDLASTPASATITGLTGDWVAAGDVDGDGKADIILGLTNETDIVRGGTLGATQTIAAAAAARFTGVTPQSLHAFDWNGDGKAEVAVGDPLGEHTFVIFGGPLSGAPNIFDRAKWIITGEISGGKFGFSLGSGDLDGDSTSDLIIGSRQHNFSNHSLHFEDSGAVYVFYGLPLPTPTLVVSRKIQNGTPRDVTLPLTGSFGIECRSGGATNDYQLVLTFPTSITFASAAVTAGTGSVSTTSGNGTTAVTVNLTGVTNAQKITVTLLTVSDGINTTNIDIPVGVLLGDANADGVVNAADATITRNGSGQLTNATNFRADFNLDGVINSADATLVRSLSGNFIPQTFSAPLRYKESLLRDDL
jgi:hypothetical protein